jgi:hypothetical protein
MITVKDFLEVIDYKITEGSEYLWDCYGINVHRLEHQGENIHTGNTVSCIFDTKNQMIYELQAWDNSNDRIYRWIHPDYIKAHEKCCEEHNVDMKNALDNINFIDLEVEEDILEKSKSIFNNQSYDERIMISIEMTDSELAKVARAAHELNITLNDFFEKALIDFVKQHKKSENE